MVAKKYAFLFPGQGAQYPKMGLDLYEQSPRVRDLFALASDVAQMDMRKILEEAPEEELKRTDLSQPLITLVNLSAAAVLRERGIQPVACAGFSLGEYAALVEAGVLSVEDCFRLVVARGKAMQAVADRLTAEGASEAPSGGAAAGGVPSSSAGGAPGMMAVLGLPEEEVERLIQRWQKEESLPLYAANFNSPRQVVVAGTGAALSLAEERFKAAGARRVVRLKVAGPFHSPLVAEAQKAFGPLLDSVPFRDPVLPLFSNVTGSLVTTGAEARALALRQIVESVRWTREEAELARLELDGVLEVGPDKVLQGLWKDSGNAAPAFGAGTWAEIEAIEK
ncbi:MAG TPA: ACP S-malonyltransferase [Termitinemataceae bacterium]|nr:ACP S-malonyltransferase [Termitinemataceae bacterium]HOM23764.1 ACP S-malonyltransferase [Termitinemataceae bacterium]HPQ00803.1 ACP S-malonyltransferase [Termitinemataceae bacterium]